MNGASDCPECGTRMAIKATSHGGGITYRVAECACGERWELEDRRARRLPPCTAVGSRVQPSTPVHSRPPPHTAANPRTEVRGVGGALPSGSDLQSDLHPIASVPPISAQTQTRVERPKVTETAAFVAFYEAYPRKKSRPDAMRAWLSMGCEPIAAEVMAGLAAHQPELAAREPDKVPYPASWLRDTEWKDPVLADTRCDYHRKPANRGRRPDAGWFSACPECKHARASRDTRSGPPAPVTDLVASTAAKLARDARIEPATAEELAGLRAQR